MTPVASDFKVAIDTLDFGSSASKIDLGALKQNVAGDNTEFHKPDPNLNPNSNPNPNPNVAGDNTEFHKLQELMQVTHQALNPTLTLTLTQTLTLTLMGGHGRG